VATITIDGVEHEFEAGMNLFEAIKEANGEPLPHFCYHPGLSIAGVCRMC
jgi:NADH-quinone oxidoreductase subunit G